MANAPVVLALGEYEAIIERGMETFVEVGTALEAIRDGELFKQGGFATYDAYLQVRWQWSRRHANRQIAAAQTARLLSTAPSGPIGPGTESVARPLTILPPDKQKGAWKEAIKDAAKAGKKVTAAGVRKVVEKITGKPTPASKVDGLRAQREANVAARAKVAPPKPPADDHDSFDVPAELSRLSKENDQLRGTIESMSTGKPEKEIAKLQDRLGRMDGRLAQEIKIREEAEKQARYSTTLLKKIRTTLKVQQNAEIIPAIQDLRR